MHVQSARYCCNESNRFSSAAWNKSSILSGDGSSINTYDKQLTGLFTAIFLALLLWPLGKVSWILYERAFDSIKVEHYKITPDDEQEEHAGNFITKAE
jgi:hypothetical protein